MTVIRRKIRKNRKEMGNGLRGINGTGCRDTENYAEQGEAVKSIDDRDDHIGDGFIYRAEPLRLTPVVKKLLENRDCPYHPGHRVRPISHSVFKDVGYGHDSSVSPAEEHSPKNLQRTTYDDESIGGGSDISDAVPYDDESIGGRSVISNAASWETLDSEQMAVTSLILTMVDSVTIKVGGVDRWSDSTDYVSWASQYNFTVGDVLVFSYSPKAHNVYEVSKATFQSCNITTGVDAEYSSGNDQIVLKEAKPYWFICTVDGHCQVGMKLAVNVTAASTNFTQSPPLVISENSAPRKLTSARIFFVAAGFLSSLALIG
ncbi:hypothetical protein KSS87_013608 [Heliosperma pusillum]|nr:hypothetical protein KSS87_013608 [Heliosperma pusillum]